MGTIRWAALGFGAVMSLQVIAVPAQSAPAPQAGQYNANTFSQEDGMRIVQQAKHSLLTLPNYSVFDSLSFGIQGKTIVLHGYASRPDLKRDAEKAVKSIAGVTTVDNQIKVLPTSPNDDQIRMDVYRRIYGQPALRRYTGSPVGFGDGPSLARETAGITFDPPMGFHAIHIIVDHGHVTLTGVVDSEGDSNIASIQANGASGVFSVDDELLFPGSPAKNGK